MHVFSECFKIHFLLLNTRSQIMRGLQCHCGQSNWLNYSIFYSMKANFNNVIKTIDAERTIGGKTGCVCSHSVCSYFIQFQHVLDFLMIYNMSSFLIFLFFEVIFQSQVRYPQVKVEVSLKQVK